MQTNELHNLPEAQRSATQPYEKITLPPSRATVNEPGRDNPSTGEQIKPAEVPGVEQTQRTTIPADQQAKRRTSLPEEVVEQRSAPSEKQAPLVFKGWVCTNCRARKVRLIPARLNTSC